MPANLCFDDRDGGNTVMVSQAQGLPISYRQTSVAFQRRVSQHQE